MKMFKFLFAVLLLGAGFFLAYVAMIDVEITPQAVTKTIPNERFFNEN
jgi:hypothetical protein